MILIAQLLGIALLLHKWFKAKRVAHLLPSSVPGRALILLHPFRASSFILGQLYPLKGQIGWIYARFSLYKKYESSCLTSTMFWDATPTYWFADADAINTICSDKSTFLKDVEAYQVLTMYGPNMVGLEGTEWKRHRAITKTAFNEANNAFVWQETVRIVNEWFIEIDNKAADTQGSPTTNIDLCPDLTRVTLLLIASAGFGRRSTWTEENNSVPPPGHKVHLSRAIMDATGLIPPRALAPKRLWKAVVEDGASVPLLGPSLLRMRDAFEQLRGHMIELVSQARDPFDLGTKIDDHHVQGALLKNMVQANMSFEKDGQVGHRSLTDEELLSNMFMFFLAGHETSAHMLCFAFVYLALYPQCQQRVFEESLRIYPDGVPTVSPPNGYKDNIPQLEFTSAVIHETLRLCPPVVRLTKLVQKGTVLEAKRFSTLADGRVSDVRSVVVPIQKGGICVLDIMGVHMNPIHWGDDVDEFKPERFIDTDTYKWPRDAFFAFSAGARACIGQRFAMTESICLLASVVRRYEILLPVDVLGLSVNEQERILMRWKLLATITPMRARVRFRRR